MFTQRHYIEIAKVLKIGLIRGHKYKFTSLLGLTIADFVRLFEKDDKKFDKEKFLNAIYGKEETK